MPTPSSRDCSLGPRDWKGQPETFDVDGCVATLARLRSGSRTDYVPGFGRDLEQPVAAALAIPPSARLVITEGNYLLLGSGGWEQVRPHLAEVWFVAREASGASHRGAVTAFDASGSNPPRSRTSRRGWSRSHMQAIRQTSFLPAGRGGTHTVTTATRDDSEECGR